MAELVHSTQSFMNAEDAIITKKRKKVEQMEADLPHHLDQGSRSKKAKMGEKKDRDSKKASSSSRRSQHYTPLNAPLDHVLMQIKDDPSLKWPEKMKGNPNKRNKNKYYRFHRDHGHDMDKCYDLKQQIENLIKQGKLRHFVGRDHKDKKLKGKVEESSRSPLGEIRVIIGGTSAGQSSKSRKMYLKVVQNVQLSRQSPRTSRADKLAITFTDEDAGRIHHPYDDAIVITLLIVDYITRKVLVDNGSSANILYYPAFQQMRLGREGSYLQQITKEVNFLMVDCSSSYNAIIGRPTLNSWKTVTSTYHLSVKFPTEYGVGQVQRDQLTAIECYLALLAMDEHMQTISIEERKVIAEKTEVLEHIPLEEGNPEKFTRIGISMKEKTKQDLVQFLRKSIDVFAWSHENMPGINPSVITHRLNVHPSSKPVRQKKRVFALERDNAIKIEV